MKAELLRALNYDHWANRRWVEVLPNLPFQDEAKDILHHIAHGQNVWIGHCFNLDEMVTERDDVALFLQATNSRWRDMIDICDLEAYINVEREGKVIYYVLADVVRFLCQHGTYHRGELRGMCRAHGFTDFLETDFTAYIREVES